MNYKSAMVAMSTQLPNGADVIVETKPGQEGSNEISNHLQNNVKKKKNKLENYKVPEDNFR